MRQANRLFVNIAATVARMGATVFMGLWTTRLVYRELGASGFGAYAAVLALTMFLTLVVDAIGAAMQRHVAFAIGAADPVKVRALVGTAVTVNAALAGLILLLTLPTAGFLATLLEAPADQRAHLATTVRWVGVLAALTTAQAPFRSYLIARQSIVVVTGCELVDAVARLGAAVYLVTLPAPSIAAYAAATTLAVGGPAVLFMAACLVFMPATRPAAPTAAGEISRFGFWLLIGVFGWKVRTQGAQILINKLCGPAATAAYNVSLQLAMYQNNLTTAVSRAARPAVVTSRGSNNVKQMRALTRGSSKLLSLCTLFFAVPLLLETRTVLTLWLGEAPELMVTMVRLAIVWMSFKDLTAGHTMAIHAGGRVARHEVGIAVIDVAALAAAGGLIYGFGADARAVPLAITVGVALQMLFKVLVYGTEAASTLGDWLRQVVLRYLSTAAAAAGVALALQQLLPPGAGRLALIFAAVGVTVVTCIWTIGFDSDERCQVRTLGRALTARLTGRPVPPAPAPPPPPPSPPA